MNRLIPIINKLQDVFNTVGVKSIDLPQIVVVGSQSAGKSSVLESIVGKDFLPRGSGMVTKRPLILQLVNLPPTETKEWGEFAHKPGRLYYDFEEIKKEIESDTQRMCGTSKTISPIAIRLTVYSSHVLDLTLVDLPGLTKISVGTQEKDISSQITKMVKKFIENPNAIILAVTAANVDLATSDALCIAREVDPDGNRTVGVLTKIDLMDKGTDAMDIFNGTVYPLKLGYVGVLNRSQHEIDTNVPIRKALHNEKKWFSQHPVYSKIADRMGVNFLTKTLNHLLMDHIMKTLPSLRITITEMLNQTKKEYSKFAEEFDQKDVALLEKLIEYSNAIQMTITGERCDFGKHELVGGAKLFDVFENVYRPIIEKLDVIRDISDQDIKTAMKNTEGITQALFLSQQAFESLVKQQIYKFSQSSQQCVEDIKKEMSNIFLSVASEIILKYSNLRDAVVQSSDKVLEKNLEKTKVIVQNLLDIETSYVNVSHPDFNAAKIQAEVYNNKPVEVISPPAEPIQQPQQPPPVPKKKKEKKQKSKGFFGLFGANESSSEEEEVPVAKPPPELPPKPQKIELSPTDQKEVKDIQLMRELTKSYLQIVRTSVEDFIPKAIMHFLVNQTVKDLQNALIQDLYRSDQVNQLMNESHAVTMKREMLKKNLDALQSAYNILQNLSTQKLD